MESCPGCLMCRGGSLDAAGVSSVEPLFIVLQRSSLNGLGWGVASLPGLWEGRGEACLLLGQGFAVGTSPPITSRRDR